MPGASQTSTRRTIVVKKYVHFLFIFVVTLDITLFLSWDRAEPFEALRRTPVRLFIKAT